MAKPFSIGGSGNPDPQAKSAVQNSAVSMHKAASDVSSAANRLKRFVVDIPALQALIAEGDQLRARINDLANKLDRVR